MTVQVTGGLGLITIGVSSIGSYFRLRRPAALAWYDNHGSLGMYLALLPVDAADRAALRNSITAQLDVNFEGAEPALAQLLEPLFRLMRNGEYLLYWHSPGPLSWSWSHSGGTVPIPDWRVVYADMVGLERQPELEAEHRKHVRKKRSHSNLSILERTTTSYYEGSCSTFYATRPEHELDAARIAYFEEKIRAGARPFAILMAASKTFSDLDSAYFVLDGHHKLRAYENLKLMPPLAIITHQVQSEEELEFDIEALAEALYPWQTRHILDHWEERSDIVPALLKNPDSPLHRHARNGPVREYHDSGRLLSEGTYVNDLREGRFRTWHENGALWTDATYHKGKPVGLRTSYYPSGAKRQIERFDEQGQYHGVLESYFETGRVMARHTYEHGQHADGHAFIRSHLTGHLESEFWYEGGAMVRKKSYDSNGALIREQVYSKADGNWSEIPVPSGTAAAAIRHLDFRRQSQPSESRVPDIIKLLLTIAILLALWVLINSIF